MIKKNKQHTKFIEKEQKISVKNKQNNNKKKSNPQDHKSSELQNLLIKMCDKSGKKVLN